MSDSNAQLDTIFLSRNLCLHNPTICIFLCLQPDNYMFRFLLYAHRCFLDYLLSLHGFILSFSSLQVHPCHTIPLLSLIQTPAP